MAHPDEVLYVENTRSDDVSIVRVPGFAEVGRIGVGHHPDDVIASPDGRTLYVNRQDTRDLVAIDADTRDIRWTVELEGIPHHLGLAADGRHVYVAIFNELRDNVVDVESREIVARPFTGFGAHGVHVGERAIWVGSMVHDHLAVLDHGYETKSFVPVPEGVRPFCPTADERTMYLQLSKTHGFVVVDLEAEEIVERVDLPPLPEGVEPPRHFPHTVNHGLKLTPDDRYVLAAGSIANYVAVYTVGDHELVKTVDVGAEPNWIVFSTDAALAYVSNRAEDTVSVLSLEGLEEIERIKVGTYPQRMAVVPA